MYTVLNQTCTLALKRQTKFGLWHLDGRSSDAGRLHMRRSQDCFHIFSVDVCQKYCRFYNHSVETRSFPCEMENEK